MAARHPERERGILLPANSIETIEKSVHGVGFQLKILVVGLLVFLRIEPEDL
jgi:hypothetical protein